MKRWCGALLIAVSILAVQAQDDLPLPDDGQPMEIEPPLLIKSRTPDGSRDVPAAPEQLDVARVEADLAKSKKNAASGERLYRAGIIAKVESEERILRVVRLEAKLAEARLEEAKTKLSVQQEQAQVVEIEAQLRAGRDRVAEAAQSAAQATQERQRAELEAAMRNLARQQKLLALGSGRRSDVSRAEKKLAELQGAGN